MTFFAAAIIGTATVGSALIGANASNKASKAATQAATSNNALQTDIYNRNTANLSPFMDRGNQAGVAQNALLGIGGDPHAFDPAFQNYLNSTGYQFQQNEGQRAITSSAAARGMLGSGATLKALQDRGQQTGASYFQRYLDNLSGISGQGLTAANGVAGVGTQYAGAVGANNQYAADATGNAALAAGSGYTNALNGLATYGANRIGQSSFGKGGGGSNAYGGGSITNWASSLPNQTPLKGF